MAALRRECRQCALRAVLSGFSLGSLPRLGVWGQVLRGGRDIGARPAPPRRVKWIFETYGTLLSWSTLLSALGGPAAARGGRLVAGRWVWSLGAESSPFCFCVAGPGGAHVAFPGRSCALVFSGLLGLARSGGCRCGAWGGPRGFPTTLSFRARSRWPGASLFRCALSERERGWPRYVVEEVLAQNERYHDIARTAHEQRTNNAQTTHEQRTNNAQTTHEQRTDNAQTTHRQRTDNAQTTHRQRTDNAQTTHRQRTDNAQTTHRKRTENAQKTHRQRTGNAQATHGQRTDSARTAHGQRTDSARTAHGQRTDSARTTHGQRTDNARTTHGQRTDNARTTHGQRTDNARTMHGQCTDNAQTTHRQRTDVVCPCLSSSSDDHPLLHSFLGT